MAICREGSAMNFLASFRLLSDYALIAIDPIREELPTIGTGLALDSQTGGRFVIGLGLTSIPPNSRAGTADLTR